MMELARWCVISALIGAAGAAVSQDDAPAPDAAPDAEAAPEAEEQPTSFFNGWDGSVSLGIFGSEGNTNEFDFRAEIDGERESDRLRSTYRGNYTFSNDDGGVSENNALVEARNDWKFEDSKWFAFVEGQFDYDEFQDWDTRVSVHGGPGYVWVDNEKQRFMTRAGLGVRREIGGADNAWQLEGLIGAEYRRQLTERQQFEASADAYPTLFEFKQWRIESRAAWEVLVDPEVNLVLKVGIENEYDTDPNGVERSDTDYFILLSWTY